MGNHWLRKCQDGWWHLKVSVSLCSDFFILQCCSSINKLKLLLFFLLHKANLVKLADEKLTQLFPRYRTSCFCWNRESLHIAYLLLSKRESHQMYLEIVNRTASGYPEGVRKLSQTEWTHVSNYNALASMLILKKNKDRLHKIWLDAQPVLLRGKKKSIQEQKKGKSKNLLWVYFLVLKMKFGQF